jgi:hypothetical protein
MFDQLEMTTIEPITILTLSCNQPIYIEAQYKAFKKYVKVPYKFIVFNAAKDWPDRSNFGDITMPVRIQETCAALDIECIRLEYPHHKNGFDASRRHVDALKDIMNYINKNSGKYWLIDSDMWPVADMTTGDFDRYFKNAGSFIYISREHRGKEIIYAWPNIWWIDNRNVNISDLSWDFAPSCDSGGASHTWIKKHFSEINWIPYYRSLIWSYDDIPLSLKTNNSLCFFLENDPRNINHYGQRYYNNHVHPSICKTVIKHPEDKHEGWYWAELYDGKIFHVRAGSNWNGEGEKIHETIAKNVQKCFIHDLN